MLTELVLNPKSVDGSGSLNWESEGSGPDQTAASTEGSGDGEEDSVVVHLFHTVMVENDTTVGINIGPRVLDLAEFLKNGRNNLENGGSKFNKGVVLDVFGAEVLKMNVSRISVSQDGVTVTWDDLSGGKGVVGEFLNLSFGNIVTDFLLDVKEPSEDFLVGQTVEGTGKTVDTTGVSEERISKSGTDEMGGVSTDVTTFVITVNGEVSSDSFLNFRSFVTHHVSVVGSPIEVLVGVDNLTFLVFVSVNKGGKSGDLGDKTDDIFVSGAPVLGLVDTLLVSLSELTGRLEVEESNGELGHWVHVSGEVLNQLFSFGRDVAVFLDFVGDVLEFVILGDFTGEEEPEKGFRKGFVTFRSLLELVDDFRDGETSEFDTILSIKLGAVPEDTGHTSHTTDNLINSNLAEFVVSVLLLDFLKLSLLNWNNFLKLLLQERKVGLGLVEKSLAGSGSDFAEHSDR